MKIRLVALFVTWVFVKIKQREYLSYLLALQECFLLFYHLCEK